METRSVHPGGHSHDHVSLQGVSLGPVMMVPLSVVEIKYVIEQGSTYMSQPTLSLQLQEPGIEPERGRTLVQASRLASGRTDKSLCTSWPGGWGGVFLRGLLELFGPCYNFSIPAMSRLATAPAPRPRGEPHLPSQDQDNKSQRGLVSVPAPSVRTCRAEEGRVAGGQV